MKVGLGWAKGFELIASVGRKKSCSVLIQSCNQGILSSQSSIRTFSQERLGSVQLTPMAIYISAEIFHLSLQFMLFC